MLKDYIIDDKFKIMIEINKINIQNYENLVSFSDNLICIKKEKLKINIVGENLSIINLLKDELLVIGDIIKIEYIKLDNE